MEYEPIPAKHQLAALGAELGSSLSFVHRIDGGQSATTDVLMRGDGTQVVLRRHGRWSIGFDDGIATREALVLGAVRNADVPVPRVLWSGKFGAATAIVTEFVDGTAVLHPADPIRWAEQLANTLAAIHSVSIDSSLAEVLDTAPPSPVDLDPSPDFAAHADGEALLATRAALSPDAITTPTFVHGDYWPGNLLWGSATVVAVLDWEGAHLGDPVSDVAYCAAELHYLGMDDAADHFVATYRDITGDPLVSFPYWMVTALCRALPDLQCYLDGWEALGHEEGRDVVQVRLNRLITEILAT
ncbi:MAG: phosphotransferase [bacterium]|nr:phosphotransferase [bacterium]